MRGERARQRLAGTAFADVRWVEETGSTNADALALVHHQGAGEGVVLVADHQTAGRGRKARTWQAPPGSSLLLSVLLRPPARVVGMTTMALGVAAAEAVEEVTGVSAGLKWPNDLVVDDHKLGGILAEADWPAGSAISAGWRPPGPSERVAVVAGMGLNVNWPSDLPPDLADSAVALNHLVGRPTDRQDLLIAILERLDHLYGDLVARGVDSSVLAEWRRRSATLGREVRVDLGADDVEGTAVDVTPEGHLVVQTRQGARRTLAVGDVVHLRPTR